MAQVFIAEHLDKLLRYWEHCNLSGEFNFQLALKTREIKNPETDLDALIGSELNRLGVLARSITGYENLRKVLMGYPYNHQNNFFPRIPKEMREFFNGDYDLFLDHDFTKSPSRIPSYLLRWNETRRACILEDTIPIPVIDLRQENWLNKLPYSSFFLKIESPFVFECFDPYEEWSIDSFLIYEDGDYVRIMSWPKEIERFLLTDLEKKHVETGISDLKKNKVPKNEAIISASKVNDWFLSDLAVLRGTSEIRSVQGSECKVIHNSIYNPEAWTDGPQKISGLYARLKVMLETINGFCKLMATLTPKPVVKIVESSISQQKPVPPRQWFELPLQTVEYFHTATENETITIKRGSGSEKSPHIRRRHTRRIVRKDGSIEEIWVEQTTIRADKLVTEQLQGGATKVK